MQEQITQQLDDAFVLDVRVVADIGAGDLAAACNTDDGCGSTCASACTSNA